MIKRLVCYPTVYEGVYIPSPKEQDKAGCLLQTYYKGHPGRSFDRPHILEVEIEEVSVLSGIL